jgi:hypothetical protein
VTSLMHALRHLDLRLGDLTHAARDGVIVGGLLLMTLLAIDWCFAPTGIFRLLVAGVTSGPLLLLLLLRLLRQSRSAPARTLDEQAN